MKKILFLILLLLNFKIFSQDIKTDTLYKDEKNEGCFYYFADLIINKIICYKNQNLYFFYVEYYDFILNEIVEQIYSTDDLKITSKVESKKFEPKLYIYIDVIKIKVTSTLLILDSDKKYKIEIEYKENYNQENII